MSTRGQFGGGDAKGDEPIAPVPRITIQAFCEGSETASAINGAAQDRRMSKSHVKTHMGGASAAVEAYRDSPTPNVIVLESSGDRDSILAQLDELAEFCDEGTKVVVVGRYNDIVLYRELIDRGVSDYLVAPLNVLNFVRAISNLYSGGDGKSIGRVVAVAGAKGGVGASTISHNLAWSISRDFDLAVVLADLDLPYGTVGLDFNQDGAQGIAEAVFAPDRVDSNVMDRLLTKCTDKLSLLTSPATLERTYDFAESGFDTAIDTLRNMVPYIVLDVPHGWTGWSRRVLHAADEIIIVAAPDLANLRNTKNLFDTLRASRPNDSKPRLVINTVGMPKRPEISIGDFVKVIDSDPISIVPFDVKLFGTAANNGQMIAEIDNGGKVSASLSEITRSVMGRNEQKQQKKGFLDQLAPIAQLIGRAKAS